METHFPFLTASWRAGAEIALAFAIGAALTLLAFREGRLLSFDGYYYCEFAKQFTTEWPDRFGNHWPFGYPLAGALLGRAGVPAYIGLVLVSLASLAILLAAAARGLADHRFRWLVLIALASAPIVAPQLGGVLTELPFAAALVSLALSLAGWPNRACIWLSVACTIVAFGLRYAGIVAIPALAIWTRHRWQELGTARRQAEALVACVASAAAIATAIAWNIARSGHASGAGRGTSLGLSALPEQLVSFGWSAPSALIAGGLRDRIGVDSIAGMAIGGILFAAIAVLCGWSWISPRSRFSRPLALVAFGYCSGMVVLRCFGEFDALYNARTFLPALAPLALLAIERARGHSTWVALGAAAVLTVGVASAARGISREIAGDIRVAVTPIRDAILPSDRIGVNDHAFTTAAYFAHRTPRVFAEHWNVKMEERFLVFSGKPLDRHGRTFPCSPEWVALSSRLVAQNRYRYLVHTTDLIALERIDPASAPPQADS